MIIIICVFVFMCAASAKIDVIDDLKDNYYLGDEILGRVEINGGLDENALLIVSLVCLNKSLIFYTTPVAISKENINLVHLPAIGAYGRLMGECRLKASLEKIDGLFLEEDESESFLITNELVVNVSLENSEILQGGKIRFSGNLDSERNYSIVFGFDKENSSIEAIISNFSTRRFFGEIEIPLNISRGGGSASINVVDEFGNRASENFSIDIIPVIAELRTSVFNVEILPKNKNKFFSGLYDYAGELVNGSVKIRLENPEKHIIESFDSESGLEKEFDIPAFSIPGKYKIMASKDGFKAEDEFSVVPLLDIGVDVEEGFIMFSNKGNILFEEEINVNASADGTMYVIPLSIRLEPGEKERVDLGLSLPGKNYILNVIAGNVSHTLSNVDISDKRGVSKKISQGLSGFAGMAIIDTDNENNFYGFIIVIILAVLIVFFVARSRLKNRFSRQIGSLIGEHERAVWNLKESLSEEKKLKKEMQGLFEKYVGKDVLEFSKRKKYGMEKKDIAVLFTDMRGFSKLFDSMDTLEVTRILDMYFKVSNEIIRINGGFINKFVGDSVMALFNAPKEEKDFVLKAVKSGVKIREEIARINARLKKQGLSEIEVGIGIDFGKAAVGALGSREKTEYTAIGVPVNVAFRLQSEGTGSQVLISERVYSLLKDDLEVEYIGEMNFKNISKPIRVYNVLRFKG